MCVRRRVRACAHEADISGDVFSFWKWQVMDRISQTMPASPPSSTSLNLFVCCTCLLDTFQPCLSPFALSIPKSLSLPTSPLPFLLPRLDCRGPYAKVRDIFLIDGTEIKYTKAPPPSLFIISYLSLWKKREAVTGISPPTFVSRVAAKITPSASEMSAIAVSVPQGHVGTDCVFKCGVALHNITGLFGF